MGSLRANFLGDMHVVLIPTYNERENITGLLDALLATRDTDILVIDDASPDKTAELVLAHGAFGSRVFLLAREKKDGLGAAYRAGFAWALERPYATITQMDADFSHDPQDVPTLHEAIEQGAQVAIGSRKVPGGRIEGWNVHRKTASAGAMLLSRLLLGLRTKDVTAGFRTWRSDFLKTLPLEKLRSNGYAFQEEMLLLAERAGAKITEVPVVFIDRAQGVSKLGKKEVQEFFATLARLTLMRRKRFLLYVVVGSAGAVLDLGVFLLLHEKFAWELITANVLATALAVVHNFLWHHLMTFHGHGQTRMRTFAMFIAVSLCGMVLNTATVYGLVLAGFFPVFAKICAIAVVTIWNYLLNSRVTFRA